MFVTHLKKNDIKVVVYLCFSRDSHSHSHRSKKADTPERKIAHREGAINVKDEPVSKVSVALCASVYCIMAVLT